MNYEFETPAVVVDMGQARKNAVKAVGALKAAGIKHRPHIKAHKSVALAKMQLEAGAVGITCAKLGEAEVMQQNGIEDILIANEIIGENKIRRLLELNRHSRVISCVDSLEGASALSAAAEAVNFRLPVFVEIDSGGERCGRHPGGDLIQFAKAASALKGIEIIGVMTYAGQIYGVTGEKMREAARHEAHILTEAADALRAIGLNIRELSGGSSLSLHIAEDSKGLTESRAGNYIFNDCNALFGGACVINECALRVITTVISIPKKNRAIIDAGTKTISSDGCSYRGGYGYVVGYPDIDIYKLNEEHGYLRLSDSVSGGAHLKIGDKLTIIPNHSCVLPNLCDELVMVENNEFKGLLPIEARGMNK